VSEADGTLKEQTHQRDNETCRFCGRRGLWLDAHHIRFRRGSVDDVLWNLVSLCRECHNLVHSNQLMHKWEMQLILWELAKRPGITGMQLIRWNKKQEKA
jgi:hypothetical protein